MLLDTYIAALKLNKILLKFHRFHTLACLGSDDVNPLSSVTTVYFRQVLFANRQGLILGGKFARAVAREWMEWMDGWMDGWMNR